MMNDLVVGGVAGNTMDTRKAEMWHWMRFLIDSFD